MFSLLASSGSQHFWKSRSRLRLPSDISRRYFMPLNDDIVGCIAAHFHPKGVALIFALSFKVLISFCLLLDVR